MNPQLFCQSCTMPMDNPEVRGTEKDGSKSNLYCKYCYKDGAFTDPHLTVDKMKQIAIIEMKKQNLPANIVQQSLDMLPGLQRWKSMHTNIKK